MMTVLVAVFGMLPLALGQGSGSELYRGLGIVVVGSLSVSTVFTLFVVPTMLSLIEETRQRFAARRRKPSGAKGDRHRPPDAARAGRRPARRFHREGYNLRRSSMRKLAVTAVFALAVGYALAHFLVAFYNHWYFAEHFWLKVGVLTPVLAVVYAAILLFSGWAWLWRLAGVWWLLTHVLAMVPAGGPDLRELDFVAVLDLEAAVVWVPVVAFAAYGIWQGVRARRQEMAKRRAVSRELELRRRLRRKEGS
jgi:hypothetical protein